MAMWTVRKLGFRSELSTKPDVRDAWAALLRKEEVDWLRIRQAIAVLTASQTMWRTLGPNSGKRGDHVKDCLAQLKVKKCPLPPSFELLMQSEAAKTDATAAASPAKASGSKS